MPAYKFAQLLKDSAIKKDIPILFMNSSEADEGLAAVCQSLFASAEFRFVD